LGQRIARHRRRRGFSQVKLAELLDRSESWVSQVERGTRTIDRLSVLGEVARVLDVPANELLPGSFLPTEGDRECPSVRAVRLALSGHPALAVLLDSSREAISRSADSIIELLLTLIPQAELAAHRLAGKPQQAAFAALTTRVRDDSPLPLLSVWGALHLVGAIVASRQERPEAALTNMRSAQEAADSLGEDRADFGTEFGPTNVALHAVAVAAELGDAGTALRRAASVDASGLSTERRARFLVDVARAHHQRRQGRELLQRLEGEVDEMASLMLATADRLSNQRQGGRCEQRSNRRRCPRCRGGCPRLHPPLQPGDRAHLPAAPGRLPVPAAGTDPRQGHGRDGHLRPGRKESMISRAPAIAHTGPQGNRHLSRLTELGPAARR
jgi:transcriptional regulator with XRE-family HTH domain